MKMACANSVLTRRHVQRWLQRHCEATKRSRSLCTTIFYLL